ncbi:S1 family peptidase [Pseudomonas allii]|uniref:Trypsin-like peptidase domain-containing protein n=1 Tax=Pseudomonas allii TaxID=2740531 RepID=A0A7Y8RLE2_9PSED|nr:serine protease [Pseudomonas allii]NWN60630.1 trypsin-like peptidase domain-containing protein [Pseudomonas allii]
MTTLSIAEQMLHSTVKLTSLKGGSAIGTGTGFFFEINKDSERNIPAIITNNHVINGSDMLMAICHLSDNQKPSGEYINCHIHLNESRIIRHPNPDIDLCAVLIGDVLNQTNAAGNPIFFVSLNSSVIPSSDEWQYFDAIEEVTMIGCPNGIYDEANNLPISRKGITASSLTKNYNGKQEFMVDMACFPGSSGSPVFVYDRNGYMDRKTNSYMVASSRLKLVGILYAGPQITNTGAIVLGQTPKVHIAAMMHLGNVIKSSELIILSETIKDRIN